MITNKENARLFLHLVNDGKVDEAYDRLVNQNFIHHNPFFKRDRSSYLKAMIQDAEAFPNKVFSIIHSLEDGDLVVTHSHLLQKSGDKGFAVVHIFRFENQKISELWDVIQAVPENEINENGMF